MLLVSPGQPSIVDPLPAECLHQANPLPETLAHGSGYVTGGCSRAITSAFLLDGSFLGPLLSLFQIVSFPFHMQSLVSRL